MSALLVVLVGTDHHPFDRLVAWADAAAVRHPGARVVVQHGCSRPPQVAERQPFLPHRELVALLATATAVACHGGPGTIMDARNAGHVPVCVPRDPRLGEHVDGHQQRFVGLVGPVGLVRAATDEPDFTDAVDDLLSAAASAPRPTAAGNAATDQARALLAAELDGLLRPATSMLRRRGRAALLRGGPR